jgi:hypothetical protein
VVEALEHTSQECCRRPCTTVGVEYNEQAVIEVDNEDREVSSDDTDDVTLTPAAAANQSAVMTRAMTSTRATGDDGGNNSLPVAGQTNNSPSVSSTELANEQQNDPSLTQCLAMAEGGKGGFEVKNGLLYHTDNVLGHRVEQLVVPQARQKHILELAHDQAGYHQGQRKTSERIRLNFYWPQLKQSVNNYVSQCKDCQVTRGMRKLDRVKITPIPRAEYPGQVIEIDIIGPIEPPSAKGHKFCLTTIVVARRGQPYIY